MKNTKPKVVKNESKSIKDSRPKAATRKDIPKLKVDDFVPNIFSLLDSADEPDDDSDDNNNNNINNIKNYTYSCYIPIDKFIENLLIELRKNRNNI